MTILQIQALFEQNKLKEAYAAILNYLKQNPKDKAGQELYQQIYQTIETANNYKINSEIQRIQNLINNNQYNDALAIALKLKEYAPENQTLLKLINQAYSAQQKLKQDLTQNTYSQIVARVTDLKQHEHFNEAFALIDSAYKQSNNPEYQKLGTQLRDEYVSHKLKINEKAMKLLTASKVLDFLRSLEKIAPQNVKLQKLIGEYSNKQIKENAINKKQYIREAERQIKVLFFQKKFAKSQQACLELTKADPKNKVAKRFYKKNTHALEVENHNTSYINLKTYLTKLRLLKPEQRKEMYGE